MPTPTPTQGTEYLANKRRSEVVHGTQNETEYLIDPDSSVGMLILKPKSRYSAGHQSNSHSKTLMQPPSLDYPLIDPQQNLWQPPNMFIAQSTGNVSQDIS